MDKTTQAVTSPDKSITLQVFSKVKVEISLDESKKHNPKVVFKCLDPPVHQASGTPYLPPTKNAKKTGDAKTTTPTATPKNEQEQKQQTKGTPKKQTQKGGEEKKRKRKSNSVNANKRTKQ